MTPSTGGETLIDFHTGRLVEMRVCFYLFFFFVQHRVCCTNNVSETETDEINRRGRVCARKDARVYTF